MSNRTTFRLPGHDLHPLAERKCLLSLLAAYSRQWNPRNLEYPWYEPWGHILAALVAEHPSFSVAPQPYLWYELSSHLPQPHTTPSSDHLMYSNDEELDGSFGDIGNVTLDSIRSTSVPSHRNRARIPDFAITRKVSFLRSGNTSHFSHLSRRVTYVGLPLLAELKASGPRSDDIRTSLSNARFPMNLARSQLEKQVHHLFRMYPHQQSVILVAITGFWWSYCIYSRQMMELGLLPSDDEGDQDDDEYGQEASDTSSFGDQDGIHSHLAQEPSGFDEEAAKALQDQLRAYGFALSSLGDAQKAAGFHTVCPDDKLKLVESGQWSDYLLYGTMPSNQVLSLILDRLRDIVHNHYRGERG